MKSIIFILIFTAISSISFSQIKQHTLLLGGGFSASTNSETVKGDFFENELETNRFSISFYPQIGYFIINNLAGGIRGKIGYDHSTYDNKLEDNPGTNNWATDYELGPFVRYYFPFSSFAVFGELNYLYGKRLYTYEQIDRPDPLQYEIVERESKYTRWFFAPTVGIVYFVNESIGIEGAIRYETGSSKSIIEGFENESDYEYEQDFNDYALVLGFQIHLQFN